MVYKLNPSRATDDDDFSCTQLPSYHQPDTKMHFFSLHGKMSPQGLLCSIGESSSDSEESPVYVNIYDVGSPNNLPCVVLLGLRAGYGSILQAEQITGHKSLFFTTWAFADM